MDSIGSILFVLWIVGSWFTHVVSCIKTASWVFLLAGAIFFPIGCVHGTGIWFGWF